MKLIHLTDIGTVRRLNEDCCWSGTNNIGDKLLIVCDGLGSYEGSKEAAEIVVDQFVKTFMDEVYVTSLTNWFNQNIDEARKAFAIKVRLKPVYMQMSTTIVVALIRNDEADVFWMGDSRAYLLDDDLILEVTTDHNLKNKLLNENASPLTLERFKEHLLGITSYVGLQNNLIIGHEKIRIKKDMILMLTSDGLHNFVDLNKIYWELKNTNNLTLSSQEIIKYAIKNKSDDNISFSAYLNF